MNSLYDAVATVVISASLLTGVVVLVALMGLLVTRLLNFIANQFKIHRWFFAFVWWRMNKRPHPDLAEHIEAREKAERKVEDARSLVAFAKDKLERAGLFKGENHWGYWNQAGFNAWLDETRGEKPEDFFGEGES